MRLYIKTMDAVLVDFDADGRVKFEAHAGTSGDWSQPTVQERRAIIHAAQIEVDQLKELLETMDPHA
jgi:hypothetical protein